MSGSRESESSVNAMVALGAGALGQDARLRDPAQANLTEAVRAVEEGGVMSVSRKCESSMIVQQCSVR